MINSKKVNVIAIISIIFSLIFSFILIIYAKEKPFSVKSNPLYAEKIFAQEIISVEIIANESDWNNMIENAIQEQFIMADIIINGTRFNNVGIRPKGNSSLTQVANSNSDRYSFRVQFNEYIKDQTCFGLESMVLNNMLGDNTYMKEYLSYDIMKTAGVDCPYFGFSNIKVNGNDWGLYLAVELYNDSYLERIYGNSSAMLYNVKSMDMGQKDDNQSIIGNPQINRPQMPNNMRPENNDKNRPDGPMDQNIESNNQNNKFPNQMPNMNQNARPNRDNMKKGKGTGGSLEYTDDNVSSYSAIFNNVVGKGTESDYKKVIQALKALSEGKELETYFDIDKILRYLAAHTVVVNLDSYSSNMAQNYYICEYDGKITILPWDYNLAWGGFGSSNASSVINFPIDTPVSGVELESRPLIDILFKNEEYIEKYHTYLKEILENYFNNNKFNTKITELTLLISTYVKNDQTAFCSYDEYQKAVEVLIKLGNLRSQSIEGQLNGTIPKTTVDQSQNPEKLISDNSINLKDLGSMMGGGKDIPNGGNSNTQVPSGFPGDMPDKELMEKAIGIIYKSDSVITKEVKEELLKLGLTLDQIEMLSNRNQGNFNQKPDDFENNHRQENPNVPSANKLNNNLIITLILVIFLIGFTIYVAKFKKSY